MGYYMAGGLFDAAVSGVGDFAPGWGVAAPVLPGISSGIGSPDYFGSGGGGGGGWVGTALRNNVPQIDLGGPMGLGYYDGGQPRRYRRMNVLNAHALRRSMRRVQGFAKFARKTIAFTSRVKMKHRRRK